jgi:hypothetical protein
MGDGRVTEHVSWEVCSDTERVGGFTRSERQTEGEGATLP